MKQSILKDKTYIGHGLMLFANMIWGLNSPVAKEILNYGDGVITPVALTLFRMLGATILFWITSLFLRKETVRHEDMLRLFFAAMLAIVFNQGSFMFGLALTSPIDASVIATTLPITTMIIAAITIKEPITGKKLGGVFLGATGALILILSSYQGSKGSSSPYAVWGAMFCLIAQLSFALYLTLFKDLIQRYSPVTLLKWMFTYATICFIPFSYGDAVDIDFHLLPPSILWAIAYVVGGATFLCYLFIPIGQKTLRPTVISMYNYVQPIVASIFAIMIGLDTFGPTKGIAVVLVFAGVYFVTRSKSKAQLDAELAKKEAWKILQEREEGR